MASSGTAEPQTTNVVAMVRPAGFGPNPETAPSNHFQKRARVPGDIAVAGLREFDAMVAALAERGVTVHVVEGLKDAHLPDEIFPNNWFSTHADGTVVLYPMCAASRRPERRRDVITRLSDESGYEVSRVVDLSPLEEQAQFLEGTGSLVLDRSNRIAYAGLSARTCEPALERFRAALDYEIESFTTADSQGRKIYHTNVLMSLGSRFAIVCAEAIRFDNVRRDIVSRLQDTGHSIVQINFDQLASFAGNILELDTPGGPIIAMSTTALRSLRTVQRTQLETFGEIVTFDIETIEHVGGGSVRCMLAEIHLHQGS